ncbi:MAG TPA: recombination mediator RecR [Candidatus Krumholzibacteria bacterium]
MFGGSLGSPRLDRLVRQLGRLPGIGTKSATRIALYLLQAGDEESSQLSQLILDMKAHVQSCERCGAITETKTCSICKDVRRANGQLCVVEQAADIFSVERAAVFRGRYHVLGGLLSPLDGIEPEQLRFDTLVHRVCEEGVKEVVLALSGSVEGEATALYVARTLGGRQIRVTRLATGIPVGGHLDFVDDLTLERAFSGRRSLDWGSP